MIVSKSAYLYTLISSGVIVVSAYTTIKTKNPKAWTVVQSRYTEPLKGIPQRIIKMSQDCKKNIWDTVRTNAERVMIEKKGFNNKGMSEVLQSTMSMIYPWKLW